MEAQQRLAAISSEIADPDRVQPTEGPESLDRLVRGVAHALNNHLSVILNYASLIAEAEAEAATSQAETKLQAREILASAEQAAGLTQQLFSLAHGQSVTSPGEAP